MSIQRITASDIAVEIHTIIKSNGNSRKERIDSLNDVADLAKELLNGLNNANAEIYEIDENLDNLNEQLLEMEKQLADEQSNLENANLEIGEIDERIEELEEKYPNLTEDEEAELDALYVSRAGLIADLTESSQTINTVTNTYNNLFNQNSAYVATLTDVVDAMADYSEAGQEIQDSANELGKSNMNVEKALERNETSWLFGRSKKIDKYIERVGYTEVGELSYYDSVDNEFIAKYDLIESKGGNSIGGKMRNATAKVYSYGQTIQDASSSLNSLAQNLKTEIEVDYNVENDEMT